MMEGCLNELHGSNRIIRGVHGMTMRRAASLPFVIGSMSSGLVVLVFYVYMFAGIDSEIAQIEQDKINLAQSIASRTELRIRDAANYLEIAARVPQMQNTDFSNLISRDSKGIPPDADVEKRSVLKTILAEASDFESIGYIMPNGDIYLVEPAAFQTNLPITNFSEREYYRQVISTKTTYVSDVFKSAATGHNIVSIAAPVFSEGSMAGMLASGMDLNVINKQLERLELDSNERVAIVDERGNEIASSRESASNVGALNTYTLDSLSRAVSGNSGTAIETIGGIPMHITYFPIDLGSNKWVCLLIQPKDDAFAGVYRQQQVAITVIAIVVAIMAISGYFLFRSMLRNANLTDRLEKVNEDLKVVNQDLKQDKTKLETLSGELQSKNEHLEYLTQELNRKAEQLQSMDTAKEEFSAMITHELKTPLVPIVGYTELLGDGTLGEINPVQKEKIQLMHDSAVSLSQLITDLLDVRKLELGRMKFDMADIQVRNVVEPAVNSFRPLAESKGISLTYEAGDKHNAELMLKCDPKRLQQVLNNLLSNAIKFVPEKTGKIEVSAKMIDHDFVEFLVQDNGIGIPDDKQQNIFRKFYQVDTSLRREAGGTGLGLAISKGIVEAHGGKMWFESKPGAGTTFYFSIPRNKVAAGLGGDDGK